jgi:hypothetical protein
MEGYKKQAIHMVQDWADYMLKDYIEPQRAGTTRGDAIGFPTKKMRAAIFLVLYPQLKLKEIAQLVGDLSDNLLRVWRTEEDFRKKHIDFATKFGRMIGKNIIGSRIEAFIDQLRHTNHDPNSMEISIIGETVFILKSKEPLFNLIKEKGLEREDLKEKNLWIIDDTPTRWTKPYREKNPALIEIIPWLNEDAIRAFCAFVAKYIDIPFVVADLDRLDNFVYFLATKKRKPLTPAYLDLMKKLINKGIDMLADPNFRREMKEDNVNELVLLLKGMVNRLQE